MAILLCACPIMIAVRTLAGRQLREFWIDPAVEELLRPTGSDSISFDSVMSWREPSVGDEPVVGWHQERAVTPVSGAAMSADPVPTVHLVSDEVGLEPGRCGYQQVTPKGGM